MNLSIRPEQESDTEAVTDLVRRAFQPYPVAELLTALRNSSAWRDLSFVACIDKDPVGHVSFTRGWLDVPDRLIEVLILSPLSVSPEWQKRGIGSRLVVESLKCLEDRIEPLVFLEGHPGFYSRVGFSKASDFGFLSPSVRIPDAAFQFKSLPGFEPSMTGRLVYPDVFWAMDSVGLRP